MKTVSTFPEFISAYAQDNEFPNINLDHEGNEGLVNALAQISLGMFEDVHYADLTKVMIAQFIPTEELTGELKSKVILSANRLINLAINIDIPLSDEMMQYYSAKACEELKIGDMVAGGDNADDWFIVALYNKLKVKAKLYNLYCWTNEQKLDMIATKMSELTAKRDEVNAEIQHLLMQKYQLENETSAVSRKH